ncbi:DUF2281 domain-containing protein [Tumidithrix helvetica PCC 7403]|uniref:hypothetical protein n=1 Tax=Tumidithrix helvetica TaxID=3457545 RepID=UPI003CC2B729
MTTKERLLHELENTPISMFTEILNFVQFMKAKRPQVDFMEFAGMAADAEDMMKAIVEEAEANRQLDLDRMNRA